MNLFYSYKRAKDAACAYWKSESNLKRKGFWLTDLSQLKLNLTEVKSDIDFQKFVVEILKELLTRVRG